MERESTVFYYSVAETLKRRIYATEYHPGDRIPSEKELAKEFGVSTITIRKALGLLVNEGLVVRKRGIGTRVVGKRDDRLAIKITGSFRDLFSWTGRFHRTKVLDTALTVCPERVRRVFSLPPGRLIWRMKRVRMVKRETVSYYINYTLPNVLEKVPHEDFETRSFVAVFQETSGITLLNVEQQVEATLADMDLSSILGIRFGDPLLFVEHVYYSTESVPVEVTHMYFRGDRFVFKALINL